MSDSYNFCPYCRTQIKDFKEEDWGLLGKNDFMEPEEIKLPMGFNMLFNSLVKSLNNQFKELDRETKKESKKPGVKKGGISISISTSRGKPPEIRARSFGNIPEFKEQKKQVRKKTKTLKGLSKVATKKFASLPKKEPVTDIRRFSEKVVYEIKMPGVTSIKMYQ